MQLLYAKYIIAIYVKESYRIVSRRYTYNLMHYGMYSTYVQVCKLIIKGFSLYRLD